MPVDKWSILTYVGTDRRLVSSVGRASDCSAGGRGFEPQTGLTLSRLLAVCFSFDI